MKEIVEQVLKEEQDARAKIDAARAQADLLIAQAKKDSADRMQNALSLAQEQITREKNDSRNASLAQKEDALRSARDENLSLIKSKQDSIPAISRRIFEQIMNIEG